METIQNILSMLVLILFMITIGFFIYNSNIDSISNLYESEETKFTYNTHSTTFDTVLLVYENESKSSYSDLIAKASEEQKEIINISGIEVDVPERLQDILDQAYGIENYFLKITPRVADISLNFVIDGSSTLEDEREELALKLPGLLDTIKDQNTIEGESTIVANIFILGSQKNTSDNACENVFKASMYGEINCEYLDEVALYEKPIIDPDVETVDFNKYKIDYNVKAPYSDEAYTNNVRKFSGGIEDYFEADWGAGIAHVSARMKDTAKLVLIFPMSDELSTSSIAQTCFTNTLVPGKSGDHRREQKVCDFCVDSCSDPTTVNRAFNSIQTGAEVAKDNEHVVYPIFAYDCDYPYNSLTFDSYFENIFGITLDVNATAACDDLSCSGCEVESGTSNICFHPECRETIIEHMEYLANETNGNIIDLQNLEELVDSVQNGVTKTLNSFYIEIGEEKEDLSKFTYTRSIVMGDNLFTQIYLEVYYDYSQKDVDDYSQYFNLTTLDRKKPTISVLEPTNFNVNEQVINIEGIASDLSGISLVEFSCIYGCLTSGITNGTSNWKIEDLILREGTNQIEIVAYDNSSLKNKVTKTITITYVAPPYDCKDLFVHCIGKSQEFQTIEKALVNATGGDAFLFYSGTINVSKVIHINSSIKGTELIPTKFIGVGEVIFDGSFLQQDISNAVFFVDGIYDSKTDTLEKNQWLIFDNLQFKDSAYIDIRIDNTENVILRNIKSTMPYQNSIYSSFTNDISIQNSEFIGTQNDNCIHLSNSGDDYIITNNQISNCQKSGIEINADPSATYCKGQSFGASNPSCDGISENILIEGNIFTNIGTGGGSVLNLISNENAKVQNNIIYRNLNSGISLWDGGYGSQWGSKNNIIRHNTIFTLDGQGKSPMEIIDNSLNNEIYNNILISGQSSGKEFGAIELDDSTINEQKTITNNVYYREGSQYVITNKKNQQLKLNEFNSMYPKYNDSSINISSTDDLFQSIINNNYELINISPALDNGINSDLSYDIKKTPRPLGNFSDIGAYESKINVHYPVSPKCEDIIIPIKSGDTKIYLTPANASQLGSIVQNAQSNTTILLQDGHYDVSGSTAIIFRKPFVTLRSFSGDRNSVVIDGGYSGSVSQLLKVRADDVTITDLTIQRSKTHPLHIEGVDRTTIHNIKIIDGGEQFIKINTFTFDGQLEFPDNGSISCSEMELTATGRTMVQNHGGALRCYTGGIDMHAGWGWRIHDNVIKEIHCKNSNLAEHAIHLWRNVKDNIVERNLLINNARGVGFGLAAGGGLRDYLPEDLEGTPYNRLTTENVGGVIRNNVIYSDIGKYADSGIALENSYGAKVYHNTIYMDVPSKAGIDNVYSNTVENEIKNNVIYIENTGKPHILFRTSSSESKNDVENNYLQRSGSIFNSISTFDFSLKSSAVEVIDQGIQVGVTHDYANNLRDTAPDLGAYEYIN